MLIKIAVTLLKSFIYYFILLSPFIFHQSLQIIYTHSKALKLLNATAGIELNNCTKMQLVNCDGISLDGIHEEAIDGENGIITLAKESECPIKIVGGTEIHYAANGGDEKCNQGWKLQIERNECIDGYVMHVFEKIEAQKWRAASGNIYFDIGQRWEIHYLPACLLESMPTFADPTLADEMIAMILQQNSNNMIVITEKNDSEICSNFGGVCIHYNNKPSLNWCKFGHHRCEESDKKCCLPDKIAYRSPCEIKGGECILANLCNQKTSTIETKICAQTNLDVMLICCIPKQKKNAGGLTIYYFIIPAILLIILLAALIILFFIYRKWQIAKETAKSALNSTGTGTMVTSIEGTLSTITATDSNLSMEFDREARSKMESVSILNDILLLKEIGKKWAEIKQNSARLTIKGKIYADFVPEDEFKIVRELGTGNYSKVFLYEFRSIDIAVKRIRFIAGSEDLKRAFVDLSILEKAKCPFITTYYGYFLDQDYIYICMEPMATCFWRILEIDLKRQYGIPEAAVGKVILSVVKALEYLRIKHEIIHRDVKPSNILLGQDGVKLCDFGIAGRLIESKAITATLGCLAYMAPERLNSDKIYEIRADVWSVGVTGLELATAKHPFEASDEMELLMKINDCAPQIHSNEPISTEFTAFLRSCLQKEFNKRPNYKQLLKSPFLRMHEKIPTDVWVWYKRKFAK